MNQLASPDLFFADTAAQAVFGETGPQPRFLLDSNAFKVLVAGLQPGQMIPVHPESAAVYHFLSGTGTMTVDGVTHVVQPGATIITLNGASRGMKAESQLIFLAAKSENVAQAEEE
ncbi:MAG: cupin domain-containing protein [Caldilineaceae bacterium]|nr:cupin domain-containing protein [Caldilineaceae bacterium]MCB9137340.1 cupin domain-containing protein [Caldilineaceae bacterium]